MPQKTKAPLKNDSAEGFVSSVFKFSIAAMASLVMYALAMVLADIIVPNKGIYGEISVFLMATNAVMTVAIFGLDQAYIRFCNEPPGKLDRNSLFRLCFYLSTSALVVTGFICSLFFATPLHNILQFEMLGSEIIPFVFLNAFYWMVARYFYVLYRMEQNVFMYTITSILMNFFYKLFYLFGGFFENQVLGMVIFSIAGLGAFSIFCLIARRKVLSPTRKDFDKTALKTILPYGAAVAPTAVMVVCNQLFGSVFVGSLLDNTAMGIYAYGSQLSNVISAVQLGFASFWSAYMYANYKTQQARIQKVHDYLNLLVLAFFTVMVAMEDVLFWVLGNSKDVQPIFPMMMLSAVFNVISETTIYGNTIARRPIFDTIGNALSLVCNLVFCYFFVPRFGVIGAAYALAGANLVMFVFRSTTGQLFYRSIKNPFKTAVALALAIALAFAGTYWAHNILARVVASCAVLLVYCIMYRKEFVRYVQLALSIVKNIFRKKPPKNASA